MKTEHRSQPTPESVPERRKRPRYWLTVLMTIRPSDYEGVERGDPRRRDVGDGQ
jgi:hypothetical protein